MMQKSFMLVFFVFLAFLSISSAQILENQTTNSSYANVSLNVSNSVAVQLTKTNYLVNDTIEGNLLLQFSAAANPELMITVRAPSGYYKEVPLTVILDNLSIPYEIKAGNYNLSNGASEKTLTFSSSGSQLVGMQVPEFSDIIQANLTLTAISGNLKQPRLDIGDDGSIDWQYLGVFQNYLSSYATPSGLVETSGDVSIIADNQTLYCQVIDLPFSKHYEIHANYRKVGTGDIKGLILEKPDDFGNAFGGGNSCDLPEDTSFGWHSCGITLPYAASGESLVCAYSSEGSGNMYEVNADTSGSTSTAYNCLSQGDSYSCSHVTLKDYFIKVKGAQYNDIFSGNQNLGDWQTAPNAALEALKKYVASPSSIYDTSSCTSNPCAIPIRVYANDSGSVKLQQAKIVYDFEGLSSTQTLYDISREPTRVVKINNKKLSDGVTLTIPLSYFGIKLMKPSQTGIASAEGYVEAGFNGELTSSEKFKLIVQIVGGSKDVLDGMKDAVEKLGTNEYSKLAQILSYDLSTAEQQVNAFNDQLFTEGDSQELADAIDTSLGNFPRSLELKGAIKDVQFVEQGDVPNDVGVASEVLPLQDSVAVKVTLQNFEIADASGTQEITLVRKEIKAKEDLDKLQVFEVISKNAAASASAVKFEETPLKIVNDDPIVKWSLPSLKKNAVKNYYYIVPGKIEDLKDAITLIAFEEEEKPKSVCGDKICMVPLEDEIVCPEDCEKPATYGWLIVVGVLFVILLLYIVFYRGKYSLGKLLSGKLPFSKKEDLQQLTDFVRKQREKGEDDGEIKKKLFSKGWSEKQVKFAFEEIAWSKGPETHEAGPLQNYVRLAREHGKNDEEIVKALLSKGWKEAEVRDALKKA